MYENGVGLRKSPCRYEEANLREKRLVEWCTILMGRRFGQPERSSMDSLEFSRSIPVRHEVDVFVAGAARWEWPRR